jgi:hypothetical protein
MANQIFEENTFNLIARVSRAMAKNHIRDDRKKHLEWHFNFQKKLANCYDCASTVVVMKEFVSIHER